MADGNFLRRVRIKNYKSIAVCDVALRPLTMLVGRNGAGKSNFLDALQFIADGLRVSLDFAVRIRGGIREIRRRSRPAVRNIMIELAFHVGKGSCASYQVNIRVKTGGAYVVASEHLTCHKADGSPGHNLHVVKGVVRESSIADLPPIIPDRLYLVTASAREEFRPAYDALSAMAFYGPNPESIRVPQEPDEEILRKDGSNLASVLGRLAADRGGQLSRIVEYLRVVVPEVVRVRRSAVGQHRETVEFEQAANGDKPWRFEAANMSDGTLRCLAILAAVMQSPAHGDRLALVGIEDPETALHPAATAALLDALREAATHTQILVTTQSPDLLDRLDLLEEGLLVVQSKLGATEIGPADAASQDALRRHLYTAGELLRMDQLETNQDDMAALAALASDGE